METKEFGQHIPTTEDRFAIRNQSVIIEGFAEQEVEVKEKARGVGVGERSVDNHEAALAEE